MGTNKHWDLWQRNLLGVMVFNKDFFLVGFLHPSFMFDGKVNGEIGNPQFAEMPSLGVSGT